MWILTGKECRCDTLRWGFEFRVEQHLLECDLWRVLHSCLHSIGVRIVIRRVGTVHGAISSAPTSRGERLEDSFNPLTHSQNWDFDRFTLLLAIFGSIGRRSPFRSESSSGVELRGLSAQTSGGMLHSSSIHHYTTLQTLHILQMIAQEEIRAVPRQLARHHDIPPNPLS